MSTQREEFLKTVLVLDTETTGSNHEIAEIIEAGFAIKDSTEWKIFQELHKPKESIPPFIESICYITNEMVADKPLFSDVKDSFQEIVNSFDVLVAHNHVYDMKVLNNHGVNTSNHKWLCTWKMIRKLTNGDDTVELTTLPYLRFRYKLPIPIDMLCHRAGNDSYITAHLLEYMLDKMEETGIIDASLPYYEQIVAWLATPTIYTTFPVGKYKGVKFEEIPTSYFVWAVKNMDSLQESSEKYDADLAETILLTITNRAG